MIGALVGRAASTLGLKVAITVFWRRCTGVDTGDGKRMARLPVGWCDVGVVAAEGKGRRKAGASFPQPCVT